MKFKHILITFLSVIPSIACQQENALPKPKAYLALEYPKAQYYETDLDCNYQFKINSQAELKDDRYKTDCWFDVLYPKMNGSIYLSYYPVDGNLRDLIVDAQKLPLSHEIKADAILSTAFVNDEHRTYGLFYEVEGNAASQAQFYLTDSINHFVTGSIYFYAKPNYDSILPAAEYLKQDMRKIMESMEWKY